LALQKRLPRRTDDSQRRSTGTTPSARRLNRTSYVLVGISMALFVVIGFRR
jgi:hypothetical protein